MHLLFSIAILLIGSVSCTDSATKVVYEVPLPAYHKGECPRLERSHTFNNTGNTEKYLLAAAENAFQQLELAELAVNNPETRQIGILMKEDYHDILEDINVVAAQLNVNIPQQISSGDQSSVDAISKEPNQKFTRIYDLLLKQNLVNITMLYEAAYYNDADNMVLQLLEGTVKKLAISHMVLQLPGQTAMI
ncbi:MAG: DUF4142 domain-containing protein [Agriterribacter sp.]